MRHLAFVALFAMPACNGEDSDPVDTDADADTDTDTDSDTDADTDADTDTDTDADTDSDTDVGTSFVAVNAIFNQKCGPCHVTDGASGHNMGSADVAAAYADSQLPSSQPGLTLGEWALNRIQLGAMPLARGCTGDPAVDAADPDCLTQAEHDTVQAWIDDGQLP